MKSAIIFFARHVWRCADAASIWSANPISVLATFAGSKLVQSVPSAAVCVINNFACTILRNAKLPIRSSVSVMPGCVKIVPGMSAQHVCGRVMFVVKKSVRTVRMPVINAARSFAKPMPVKCSPAPNAGNATASSVFQVAVSAPPVRRRLGMLENDKDCM